MSTMEREPGEVVCRTGEQHAAVELLEPRDVPLGGPRAMSVRRTLPQRGRSLIGAWCFLDHYGPDDLTGRGMQVPRHPHTGLATVSWLFSGEIEHRDSTGAHAWVRPGEVNLMTAGRGVSHSEFSTPGTRELHGAQLWLALPDATRHVPPSFEHHRAEVVTGEGTRLEVFLGSLAGVVSPVRTHTPVVGAQVDLDAGATLVLDLDPRFEHGVLLDAGELEIDGVGVPLHHLAYVPTGRDRLVLRAGARVRALLIGGEPLGEQIVMWWNFVGRSHEEVVAYRAAWQAEIGAEPAVGDEGRDADGGEHVGGDGGRFGPFAPGTPAPLPAPVLPALRMRPRG